MFWDWGLKKQTKNCHLPPSSGRMKNVSHLIDGTQSAVNYYQMHLICTLLFKFTRHVTIKKNQITKKGLCHTVVFFLSING